MAILEPIAVDGITTYTTQQDVYYVLYDINNADPYILNGEIITPRKLFIQTTLTELGKLELIAYVENYTP